MPNYKDSIVTLYCIGTSFYINKKCVYSFSRTKQGIDSRQLTSVYCMQSFWLSFFCRQVQSNFFFACWNIESTRGMCGRAHRRESLWKTTEMIAVVFVGIIGILKRWFKYFAWPELFWIIAFTSLRTKSCEYFGVVNIFVNFV